MTSTTVITAAEQDAIFLRPRPLVLSSGSFLLLPLLSHRVPLKPLPTEIWIQILAYVFADYDSEEPALLSENRKLSLLLVCKKLSVRRIDRLTIYGIQ